MLIGAWRCGDAFFSGIWVSVPSFLKNRYYFYYYYYLFVFD